MTYTLTTKRGTVFTVTPEWNDYSGRTVQYTEHQGARMALLGFSNTKTSRHAKHDPVWIRDLMDSGRQGPQIAVGNFLILMEPMTGRTFTLTDRIASTAIVEAAQIAT